MKKIDIALLGCGLIGSNIINLWKKNPLYFEKFNIKKILVKDLSKPRHISLEGLNVINDPQEIIKDDDIKIIIDATGFQDEIIEIIKDLMLHQKSIISSNIFLVQKYYSLLKNLAAQKNVFLKFSPALGFNTSVIEEKIKNNVVEKLVALLDDKANSLITEIEKNKSNIKEAKEKLEKLGVHHSIIEKTVSGELAINKLTILIHLITGRLIKDSLFKNSLNNINISDVHFAQEYGYSIKQVSYFENKGNYFRAFVAPALISSSCILACLNTEEIGLCFEYKDIGKSYYINTISNSSIADLAFADLIKIKEDSPIQESRLLAPAIEFKDETKFNFNYYIRIYLINKPDAIINIIALFKNLNIQIQDIKIAQASEINHLNIFIITHLIDDEKASQIIKELLHFDFVKEAVKIRIM